MSRRLNQVPKTLCWLTVLLLLAGCATSRLPRDPAVARVFSAPAIREQMKQVFRWQLANKPSIANADWERGAFYTGVMAAWNATRDQEYLDRAHTWGTENHWQLNTDKRGFTNADNQACAQTYLDLYFLEGDPAKFAHFRQIADQMLANPPRGRQEWWWCDSLYMAPAAFLRLSRATGDPRYAEFMHVMWWDTTDFLYSKDDHLYYRDKNFFNAKTKHGQKVFWSRGNGWVIGGLASVLQELPKDDPHRPQYLRLYHDLAASLAAKQGADGLWRTSLLDPEEFPMPETSGTAFDCYALAWGVNEGLLSSRQYLPVIVKAWAGLNRCVDSTGKLGWVQHVAGAPGAVEADRTREYASGAFLLAGAEVLRLVENGKLK